MDLPYLYWDQLFLEFAGSYENVDLKVNIVSIFGECLRSAKWCFSLSWKDCTPPEVDHAALTWFSFDQDEAQPPSNNPSERGMPISGIKPGILGLGHPLSRKRVSHY